MYCSREITREVKDTRLSSPKLIISNEDSAENEQVAKSQNYDDDNVTGLPLANHVASTLRDMIVQDKLKPDMRIQERQLSEKLKVSRTPLREAIGILVS